MTSSLVSNTNQVHFANVLAMDNSEMVAMFEALVASGLNGFLGCMSDIFESALIEFYQNASVRDGKVVSTVQGELVEISEEVFARTFQLSVEGLIDINEVPNDLIFYARTEFSFTGEQLTTSCKKREIKIEYRLISDIVAKSITVKAGSFDVLSDGATETVSCGTVVEKQPVQRSVEKEKDADFGASEELVLGKKNEGFLSTKPTDEELMSLDDLLMQISDDMMLPSVTAAEVTKIKFGLTIEIHEVQDKDWYNSSLPKISAHDKGKKPLEAADDVKGNPAREMVQLICGDVEFLVQLREQVIQDVVSFFHSFSLSQLIDLESVRVIAEKEKHMLHWTETTSLETAVKRRMYIIVKYREMLLRKFFESHRKYFAPGQPCTAMASQIIELLSAAHLQLLDALMVQEKYHGLIAERPCSSKSFDDSSDISGVVLAQFYSLAKSTCWVRPMVLIDGIWTPLQGNDFWRRSCRLSLFVNKRQLPKSAIEDCFAPHCYFIEPDQYWGAAPSLIKTWGWFRVCTDIIRYSMFGCLRPVGSVNPCRDIVVKSSVVDILEKAPGSDQIHRNSGTSKVGGGRSPNQVHDRVLIFGKVAVVCRYLNEKKMPGPVFGENFVPHVPFIEPVQYWEAAPCLIKTWRWTKVCTEIIKFSMFGCLRPVSEDVCQEIVVYNLGVERLPADFLKSFAEGVHTDSFVGYFGDSNVQSDLEIDFDFEESYSNEGVHTDSFVGYFGDSNVQSDLEIDFDFEESYSNAPTVYRSSSPFLQEADSFALGPAIFSGVAQEEQLYYVESPESPPPLPQREESSSLSWDSQMHFDSTDIPLDATTEAQTSIPAAPVDFSPLLNDLQASLSQCVDASRSDVLSRLHTVEHGLQDTLGHQNDYFQSLIHDSLAFKSRFNALDAKLLLLDGQIGDLFDYIRGGDAKKGEGSSIRPQPPPYNVQGQGSGGNPGEGSGPTVVRLIDIADRIREDDRRQMEAEREICTNLLYYFLS
ncbi:actin-interacting protein 1-like [Dorcoceras hygrometricum]|uniref:Actin-interacting protein 1-like n=1 Tax=Dorcoceras hygrometricum TaxID=472368 RepID=A0A2Z7BJ01_9LAMI|nr:actin-interacting protein 1-like [Dorcoceras hygrometricum]